MPNAGVALHQVSRPLRRYQVEGQPVAVLVAAAFLAVKETAMGVAEEGIQVPLLSVAVTVIRLVQQVLAVYKVL